MNERFQESRYVLLGSPRELEERKQAAYGNPTFLLINVSDRCNQKCSFCWTHENTFTTSNKSMLDDKAIDSLLEAFYKSGGKTCAIMSDGEPLFSDNMRVTKRIIGLTGKFGLNMLLFTNGKLLDKRMIDEMIELNPGMSFVISINAFTMKLYDDMHGDKGGFKIISKNTANWKDFCAQHNRKTINSNVVTQLGIHFVENQANTNELHIIQELANRLNCKLNITEIGFAGRAAKNREQIKFNERNVAFLDRGIKLQPGCEGPTAITYNKQCAYISSHRNLDSHNGITIHSLKGTVLVCPYFVGLGSEDWFELEGYFRQGGVDTSKWLTVAVDIASAITDSILRQFGDYYCLNRHHNYYLIESFMIQLNNIMKAKVKRIDIQSNSYFDEIITILNENIFLIEKNSKGIPSTSKD